jgi:formate dehydrogenase major subunit
MVAACSLATPCATATAGPRAGTGTATAPGLRRASHPPVRKPLPVLQPRPRTERADRIVKSICPYCAVGCGQLVYVKDEQITDIEGDPESPISEGCLCPKGAATRQLVTGDHRVNEVLYRRPGGTAWEPIALETAMDMVGERVARTRDEHWQQELDDGRPVRRTMAMAHIGGATLDNEENYLLKKLYTALGIIQVENQARI